MPQRWWRSWSILAVVAAPGAIGVGYLVVHYLVEKDRPPSLDALAVAKRLQRAEKNYTRIEDGLYLGGLVSEPPPGTRAVLNVCGIEDRYQAEVHSWAPIPDAAPAPSLDWLREQVAFIDTQRRTGRQVFVHCHAGISRSALVTAAYLMARNHWTRTEALEHIRTQRPVINPNPSFMRLLLEWEETNQRK